MPSQVESCTCRKASIDTCKNTVYLYDIDNTGNMPSKDVAFSPQLLDIKYQIQLAQALHPEQKAPYKCQCLKQGSINLPFDAHICRRQEGQGAFLESPSEEDNT